MSHGNQVFIDNKANRTCIKMDGYRNSIKTHRGAKEGVKATGMLMNQKNGEAKVNGHVLGTNARHQMCSKKWSVDVVKNAGQEVGESSRAVAKKDQVLMIGGSVDVDKKSVHHVRTRAPPLSLFLFVKTLSDKQKESLRDIGFGVMEKFEISEIPSKLGLRVLDNFDPVRCTLNINGEDLLITKHTIHGVLGVPMGDVKISALSSTRMKDAVTREWRDQFPATVKRIYPSHVFEKMEKQPNGGKLFKLNFLVLYVTIMAESIKCGTVNQKFLPCMTKLGDVKNMDWCGYILDCLKRTTSSWNRNSHFNGPLIFLVLFYANMMKAKTPPNNEFMPVFRLWKSHELVELENDVMKLYGTVVEDSFADDETDSDEQDHMTLHQIMERNTMMKTCKRKCGRRAIVMTKKPKKNVEPGSRNDEAGVDHVGASESHQSGYEGTKKPKEEYLKVVGKNMAIISDLMKVTSDEICRAITDYPDVEEFKNMKKLISNYESISKINEEGADVVDNQEHDPGWGLDDINPDLLLQDTQFFNSPTVMKQIEIMEKSVSAHVTGKPSHVGRIDDTIMRLTFEGPSFDLGLSQNTFDIGDHSVPTNEDEEIPVNVRDKEVCVTPAAEVKAGGSSTLKTGRKHESSFLPKRKCEDGFHRVVVDAPTNAVPISMCEPVTRQTVDKRVSKPTAFMLSPYVARTVSISGSLAPVERRISDCIFAARLNPKDIIFKAKSIECERVVLESMKPGVPIASGIIDAWSVLLNYDERMRDPTKVARLFCNTSMVNEAMFSKNDDLGTISKDFILKMKNEVKNSEFSSIEEIDLVFFPIVCKDRIYVICYNLRTHQLHIIDSLRSKVDSIRKRYGKLPVYLTSLFVGYLSEMNHPRAVKMIHPDMRIIRMSCSTAENVVDCGIYALRHMEMYKDDGTLGFESGFTKKSVDREKQINELRVKYLTKLLLSEINDYKDSMISEYQDYDKLTRFEKAKLKADASDRIEARMKNLIN